MHSFCFPALDTSHITTRTTDIGSQARRAQINGLYNQLLLRNAEQAGLDYWDQSGLTIDQIRQDILSSYEYNYLVKHPSPTASPAVAPLPVATPSPVIYPPMPSATPSPYYSPLPTPTLTPTPTVTPQVDQRRVDITNLYQTLLNRAPDQGGFDYFYNSGMTIDQIRSTIMRSQEYTTLHASSSPSPSPSPVSFALPSDSMSATVVGVVKDMINFLFR